MRITYNDIALKDTVIYENTSHHMCKWAGVLL